MANLRYPEETGRIHRDFDGCYQKEIMFLFEGLFEDQKGK